ncbi:hypothetical protein O181_098402 [Austropuccinia psidii MF-1]|uniref:Integrase catalytic domain-containing protein n=1 Tax=Austropuccinia psidii MF-1 TaxID=1389203 RepID=A0A9Q3JAB8_9BASI|nr:hypothetical protein [Austropuccinia psidii MF-1]
MVANVEEGCGRLLQNLCQMSKSKKVNWQKTWKYDQDPRAHRPWEIVHMDWVTGLPPGGDRSYNACLVIAERFSKTPIFLPCHKDDTAKDTALLIWNRVVSWTGIFQTSLVTEIPNSPQHYGQIFTNYLGKNYPLYSLPPTN